MAKILDLDADLDLDAGDDEPIHTRKIKLFGKEWTVVCDLNSFSLAEISTLRADVIVPFLQRLIAPDEWGAFSAAMSSRPNFTSEKLWKIVNGLAEAAMERPTERASVSTVGPTKRTSAPRSPASTSSPRGARSRR